MRLEHTLAHLGCSVDPCPRLARIAFRAAASLATPVALRSPLPSCPQLLKYVSDRAQAVSDLDPSSDPSGTAAPRTASAIVAEPLPGAPHGSAEMLRLLWGALRVLVKHSDGRAGNSKARQVRRVGRGV